METLSHSSHHIYLGLYSPLLDLGRLFSFLILHTPDRSPWMGDQPVAGPLTTHRTTQTQTKRTQTSMPREGFETTISAFQRAKTVHVLDRTHTVIGKDLIAIGKYSPQLGLHRVS
jgi:hypothetical protein